MGQIGRFIVLSAIILNIGCGGGSGSGSDDDISYVALGASDAAGIGANPLNEGYVFEIAEGIEQRGVGVELTNLGIPGAEIDEIEDIAANVALEVEGDIDLVTIWTGSNDLVSGDDPVEFESRLATLFEELRGGTNAFIAIATLPDLTQLPRFVEEPDANVTTARVSAFNNAIVRQAGAFGATVVDISSVPVSDLLVSSDGFHPSNEGHELLADLFLRVIEPQLPQLTMLRAGAGFAH